MAAAQQGDKAARSEGKGGRMRLYSGPLSMFGAKAQIAANEKGLDIELIMVPFSIAAIWALAPNMLSGPE